MECIRWLNHSIGVSFLPGVVVSVCCKSFNVLNFCKVVLFFRWFGEFQAPMITLVAYLLTNTSPDSLFFSIGFMCVKYPLFGDKSCMIEKCSRVSLCDIVLVVHFGFGDPQH